MSAAHCFQNLRRPINELKIVLGEFDVNNEEGNEVVIAARKVEKRVEFTHVPYVVAWGYDGSIYARDHRNPSGPVLLLYNSLHPDILPKRGRNF